MPRSLALTAPLWGLVACAAEAPAERVADLVVDPGSTAVAVLPGPGGSTLVTVANGPRGVLEVFVASAPEGPWELFGSAFAGSNPSQVVTGMVAGVHVLFVLGDNEVRMLEVDPTEPGRLGFPVRLLQAEGMTSVDAGDLDADGDDEVVAGGRGGIRTVGGLAAAIGIVPSQLPPLDRQTLPNRQDTAAVAVQIGAGRIASAVVDEDEPIVRVDPLIAREAEPQTFPVPAVAAELVATEGGGLTARLEDGDLIDVLGGGAPLAAEVARIARAEGGLVAARQDGSLGRSDGSGALADLDLRFAEPPIFAAGAGLLAVVEPVAARLQIFRLAP